MLFNLGIININSGGKATDDSASPGGYDSIPEKCRPTAGYTEESWKEHLSHHAETKDCLKYFN
ncbi:MAG TPA: hypothetical protein VJI69_03625 [Bacteroidia bacterium]|nr:hypothetical protein [Bacteroidia bacterium]